MLRGEVAPTGIDPVTFRVSVERSTNGATEPGIYVQCPTVVGPVCRGLLRRDPDGTRTRDLRRDRAARSPTALQGLDGAETPTMKLYVLGDPNGIRTRAAAVKGRCPRPLNDGASGAVFCDCRKPSIRVIPNEGKTLIQQSLRTNSRSWCPHASEMPTSNGHSRSEFNCCPHASEVPKL